VSFRKIRDVCLILALPFLLYLSCRTWPDVDRSEIIAWAICLPVGICLKYITYVRGKTRRKEMAGIAARLGCEFDGAASDSFHEGLSRLRLFSKGTNRRAPSIMRSEREGVTIRLFDYHCDLELLCESDTRSHGVAVLNVRGQAFPRFVLRPETFTDKLAALAGLEDKEFSVKHHDKCEDNDRDAFERHAPPQPSCPATVTPRRLRGVSARRRSPQVPDAIGSGAGRRRRRDGRRSRIRIQSVRHKMVLPAFTPGRHRPIY
jgi:hypothetical protein